MKGTFRISSSLSSPAKRSSVTSSSVRSPPVRTSNKKFSTSAGPSTSPRTWKVTVPLVSASGLLATYFLLQLSPKSSLDAEVTSHSTKLISTDEVAKHTTEDNCWVIINGKVWDLTDFLESHPGGEDIILMNAGKDVSKLFNPLHPKNIAENTLPSSAFKGFVDPATVKQEIVVETDDERRVRLARASIPLIEEMVNIYDIEAVAAKVLSKTAYAYYCSAADGLYTKRENEYAFKRYWFLPRILHHVSKIDLSTTILGIPSSLPIFVSPAAQAKLGHPLGEVNITKGAYRSGIPQFVSINASCSLEEICEARGEGQGLVFQIYLDKDRAKSEKLVKKVEGLGFKAIVFTVDSAVPGKREMDIRAKPVMPSSATSNGKAQKQNLGVAHAISGYQDADLSWEDVKKLKSLTDLPVVIKGIQCVDDVVLAAEAGVEGVVISNHGGRSCDFSLPPIDILYELRQTRPDVFDKLEVFIDGGVKRGSDVVKALCLGAKAVGMGRPYLYGNGAYGEDGVAKVSQIIGDEIAITMRLIGATKLSDLKPSLVRFIDRPPAPVVPPLSQE